MIARATTQQLKIQHGRISTRTMTADSKVSNVERTRQMAGNVIISFESMVTSIIISVMGFENGITCTPQQPERRYAHECGLWQSVCLCKHKIMLRQLYFPTKHMNKTAHKGASGLNNKGMCTVLCQNMTLEQYRIFLYKSDKGFYPYITLCHMNHVSYAWIHK